MCMKFMSLSAIVSSPESLPLSLSLSVNSCEHVFQQGQLLRFGRHMPYIPLLFFASPKLQTGGVDKLLPNR